MRKRRTRTFMSGSKSPQRIPSRDPPGSVGHPALAIQRDLGSAVSHAGLSSTTTLRRPKPASRARFRAFNIRASPIRPCACSRPAWPMFEGAEDAPRDRDRHGGGDAGADGPGQGRRPRRRRRARCSARASMWSRNCCRASASTSTLVDGTDLDQWKKAVRPNTKTFFMETPANPTLEVIDIAAVAEHRACGRRASSRSTMCSRRRSGRARSSSAPIAWSIRPPSISTARAAASAAWCSARQQFIQDNIHNLHRQTGPVDVAVQCLGDAEGAGDTAACACASRRNRPPRSPTSSPAIRS